MAKKYKLYLSWITKHLTHNDFILAFIFGSVVIDKSNPNDCDLFLVTKHPTDTIPWNDMRKRNEDLKKEFFADFNLKLSIQLFSIREFEERSNFIKITMQRPKLFIIE